MIALADVSPRFTESAIEKVLQRICAAGDTRREKCIQVSGMMRLFVDP